MNREFVQELMQTKGSARSLQKNVGPSEIGGCRRKVWSKINAAPKTNPDTVHGAAWMGTAIHAALEKALQAVDPWQERYEREQEVTFGGITGHVDVYDNVDKEVIDWKTTTKKNLSSFEGPQKWMQVQLYAYLLTQTGKPVHTVTLVGIPRDGNERDIRYVSALYDEAVALEGIAWLQEVQGMQEPPEPEKHVRFCKDYCGFYDPTGLTGCTGLR